MWTKFFNQRNIAFQQNRKEGTNSTPDRIHGMNVQCIFAPKILLFKKYPTQRKQILRIHKSEILGIFARLGALAGYNGGTCAQTYV